MVRLVMVDISWYIMIYLQHSATFLVNDKSSNVAIPKFSQDSSHCCPPDQVCGRLVDVPAAVQLLQRPRRHLFAEGLGEAAL